MIRGNSKEVVNSMTTKELRDNVTFLSAGEHGGAKAPVGSGDGADQGRTEAAAPAYLDFCLRTGTFCLVLEAVLVGIGE